MTLDSGGMVRSAVAGFLGGGVGVASGAAAVGASVWYVTLGGAGLALVGAMAVTALLGCWGYAAITPSVMRWSFRRMERELVAPLDALAAALRSVTLFGDAPPPPRLPPGGGDDDATFITMVS